MTTPSVELVRLAAEQLRSAPGALDFPHRSRRVFRRDDRTYLELRDSEAGHPAYADLPPHLEALSGVRRVEFLGVTGRLLVVHDATKTSVAEVASAVDAYERDRGIDGDAFRRKGGDLPADPQPTARTLLTLGADVAGLGLSVVARTLRLPTPPVQTDLAAVFTIASYVPWLRDLIDTAIPEGVADVALAGSRAISSGLAQSTTGPAFDIVHQLDVLSAHEATRQAWDRNEERLARAEPAGVAALRKPERATPLPAGSIERFSKSAWLASLGGAGVTLATTGNIDRTVSVLLAGAPKATTWGREATIAQLSRLFAARNAVVLDRRCFERFDRVDTLIITGSLLESRTKTGAFEPHPYAAETVAAAHEAELRVLVAGDEDGVVAGELDGVVPERALAARIARMQKEGRVVALVAEPGDPAFLTADVGLCIAPTGAAVDWNASIVGGTDLLDAYVLARSIAVARTASRHAAHIALAGAGVGSLLAFGAMTGGTKRVGTATDLASLVAHANSLRLGLALSREDLPTRPDVTPYYALDTDEALDFLRVTSRGLSSEEAAARLGERPRPRTAGTELARAVAGELINPFTPFLAAGAGLSALAGSPSDAVLVASVLGVNAVIGGVQTFRSERALAALLDREPLVASVLRDGDFTPVPSTDLVPGDIIHIIAGDAVPADCRVLSAVALEVDESSITGESLPVLKSPKPVMQGAAVADRTSMVYAGTSVAAGAATALVTATGRRTEAYRGLLLGASGAPETGVEARLESLTTLVTPLAVGSALGIIGMGVVRGRPLNQTMSSAVSLAVAAVPEGLPLLATAAQQASAARLSKHGVIVRNARAIEALGRVDVLCVDKTGTLTAGRMRVASVSDGSDDVPLAEVAGERLEHVLRVAVRATPSRRDGKPPHITDRALLKAGKKLDVHSGDGGWERLEELPFEPARGYHATQGRIGDTTSVSVKGAPEVVLPRCTHRLVRTATRPLGAQGRKRLEERVAEIARRGQRVLAVAERRTAASALDPAEIDGLTFVGFVAIGDPVRKTAGYAVDTLRRAGVDVIMITGDHPSTAAAIASELGFPDEGNLVTGNDVESLPLDELGDLLTRSTVGARVTPEHKARIVKALQGKGRVVAMTGDGANDAGAIRLADVGIALGKKASAAARDASDLVVTDDRVETIVAAVVEGRSMWTSVRDATAILVGGNLGETLYTLGGTAITGTPPLNARQLLLVNLVTDALPAMAMAVSAPPERSPEELLETGPDRSLGDELTKAIVSRAVATTLGTAGAYVSARLTGRRTRADTVGLAALIGAELGQTLLAGHRSRLVVVSTGASALLTTAVIQTPGLSQVFGCTPLGPIGWSQAAGGAVAGTVGSLFVPGIVDRFWPERR